jgi:hypothetical protein
MNLETPEVSTAVNTARKALEIASAFKVDSDTMYEMAGSELKEIKAKRNQLDALRKSMTAPLDESKKKIMDFFRQPLDWLDDAEAAIKRGMLTFKQAQERKEREERERAAAEAKRIADEIKAKNPDAPPPVVIVAPPVTKAPPKVSGVSTRLVWKARVTDLLLVPREYLVVDEAKLGAMARATKGTVSIPGVEFYSEEVMAARG